MENNDLLKLCVEKATTWLSPVYDEETRKEVNQRLPEFMAVSKFRIHPEEFAKTPKRSIKRFLYTKGN